METKLVIVESPSKSKTIEQYLGEDYRVLSSKGHIRDLAISGVGGLGLDIENKFTPTYEVISQKKQVIKDLKQAVKNADELYLATDPDREGEAISWHLEQVLNTDHIPTKRVIFNEITKDAVINAFDHPRDIDFDLVSSQETRRILDRIIGFKLSKLLQNKIKSKSAGRVQSATLKILVEREKEIDAFEPEEYWKVKAIFNNFEADLLKFKKKKASLSNKEETDAFLASLSDEFLIEKIKVREKKRSAKLPFITSSLQQVASTRLGFSSQKTMLLAQRLYEGVDLGDESVGLITYMRTDSTRLSPTFTKPTLKYIESTYGKEYKGRAKRQKKGLNVQDAHEAIRPTNIKFTPKYIKKFVSKDTLRLYKLIYARSVASLMKPAVIKTTNIDIINNDAVFRASAKEISFDGFLKVYMEYDTSSYTTLPHLEEKTVLQAEEIETKQLFTNPPPRYTEARLIKEMEELGIGRPSTYSQTISTLIKRKYVRLKEKKFFPTKQGKLTIEKLDEFFSTIISVDYTAKMEKVLDEIATGDEEQYEIISSFYESFIPLVEHANENMKKLPPEYTGETCPKCGSKMVFRTSRYGRFEACSNYPECKYIKQDESKKEKPPTTGIKCTKCGKGEIVQRTAKRGKNKGKKFYACDNFPKCKNMLFGKPTGEHCPDCGHLLIEDQNKKVFCQETKSCGYVKK